MKFYCDHCQTKYSIADEKVRGKVLKVRCKKCSHIITVREAMAPERPVKARPQPRKAAVAPPLPPPLRKVAWHYAINGESFGPFEERQLMAKFASGELGDAVYVWNENFVEWKPVSDVALFASALKQAAQINPPKLTLSVSQPLEAIDREQVERQEAASGGRQEPGILEQSQAPEREARKDRLQALRARLQLDDTPEVGEQGSPLGLNEDSEDATELMEFDLASMGDVEPTKPFSRDFALAETLPDSDVKAQESPEESAGVGVYDGLFSSLSDAASEPEEVSGHTDSEGEEGAVPFYPSAPKLVGEAQPASRSRTDEITGSLLIQINAIKSDGRKRAIATAIAVVVGIAVIGAAGYYGWTHRGEEIEVEEVPRVRMDNVGKAPQFREITEEERDRVLGAVVMDEELVISREDSRAAYEQEERRASGGDNSAENSEGMVMPRIDPSAYRRVEGELDGMSASKREEATGTDSRFRRGGLVGVGGGSSGGLAAGSGDFDDERLRAMAAVQTDTQRGVYNPRGEFDELQVRREALTGADIARGMQNVMNSVGACRERHLFRGGTLTESRVEVTLDVLPTGRVDKMVLSPASLRDTDFGRCMGSHTGRWRFPPFQGETTQVRTPFHLQD